MRSCFKQTGLGTQNCQAVWPAPTYLPQDNQVPAELDFWPMPHSQKSKSMDNLDIYSMSQVSIGIFCSWRHLMRSTASFNFFFISKPCLSGNPSAISQRLTDQAWRPLWTFITTSLDKITAGNAWEADTESVAVVLDKRQLADKATTYTKITKNLNSFRKYSGWRILS